MIAKSGAAATLVLVGTILVAGGGSVRIASAADSAPLDRTLPPSNSALLLAALRGVSVQLAKQAPVTPGSRIVLETDGQGTLALDARQALIEAFTARRIEVVLGNVGAQPAESAPAPQAADTSQGFGSSSPPTTPPTTPPTGSLGEFSGLQRERLEQAARAESLARASAMQPPTTPVPASGSGAVPPSTRILANGDLPRLAVRVEDARVDYVKMYRGGILGAYRVERRANARIDMRLVSPHTEAVSWTASADTSLGDVVLRSDLPSLETKTRPETVGQLPQSGFKKILEPVLVIALVAGLVSLFYQNRP
jgi:hypothetical protein